MESATDQPDAAALQQELDGARRFQQFLGKFYWDFHHSVAYPLTHVTTYAEIINQARIHHEIPPEIDEYISGMSYGARRATDAFQTGMETFKLLLDADEQAASVLMDELANTATLQDEPPVPSINVNHAERLLTLNTILLQLFHTWRFDFMQNGMHIKKLAEQNKLEIIIQLIDNKASEAQAQFSVEPAALALEKFGGHIEVTKAEADEIIIILSLPDGLTM